MNFKIFIINFFILIFGHLTNAQEWMKINHQKTEKTKVKLLDSKKEKILIEYEFNAYSLKKVKTPRGNAVKLNIPNCTKMKQKGAPELPKISESVIISEKEEMKVKVVKSKYIEIDNLHIAPSKGVISRDKDPLDYPWIYGGEY